MRYRERTPVFGRGSLLCGKSDSLQFLLRSKRAGEGRQFHVHDNVGGSLRSANVGLGYCSIHTATEELAELLGPVPDSADARSIFSTQHTQLTRSAWDAWVARGILRVHPGATPAELSVALSAEPAPQRNPRLASSPRNETESFLARTKL